MLFEEKLFVIARRNHPVIKALITLDQHRRAGHVTSEIAGWTTSGRAIEEALGDVGSRREKYVRVQSSLAVPCVVASSDPSQRRACKLLHALGCRSTREIRLDGRKSDLIHTSEFALSVVKTFGDRMADGSMPKRKPKSGHCWLFSIKADLGRPGARLIPLTSPNSPLTAEFALSCRRSASPGYASSPLRGLARLLRPH